VGRPPKVQRIADVRQLPPPVGHSYKQLFYMDIQSLGGRFLGRYNKVKNVNIVYICRLNQGCFGSFLLVGELEWAARDCGIS